MLPLVTSRDRTHPTERLWGPLYLVTLFVFTPSSRPLPRRSRPRERPERRLGGEPKTERDRRKRRTGGVGVEVKEEAERVLTTETESTTYSRGRTRRVEWQNPWLSQIGPRWDQDLVLRVSPSNNHDPRPHVRGYLIWHRWGYFWISHPPPPRGFPLWREPIFPRTCYAQGMCVRPSPSRVTGSDVPWPLSSHSMSDRHLVSFPVFDSLDHWQ